MTTFIVCCETTTPELLDGVEIVLTAYGEHAQIQTNLWALKSDKDPKALRDDLKLLTESDESEGRVFVVQSGRVAAWSRSICPNNWLIENL